MDIYWDEHSLRIWWGNTYRAIDSLCDEIIRLWEESHEQFYACLLRLLRLHREFYRVAVKLLITEGADDTFIQQFNVDIRKEQKELVEILRWMQRTESLKERIFRKRRVEHIVSVLEKLVWDIIIDWKIEEWTNELIYHPDDE